eukprot:2836635-Amphidinium_carterae.1
MELMLRRRSQQRYFLLQQGIAFLQLAIRLRRNAYAPAQGFPLCQRLGDSIGLAESQPTEDSTQVAVPFKMGAANAISGAKHIRAGLRPSTDPSKVVELLLVVVVSGTIFCHLCGT